MQMPGLEGKVALITGGGSGIGRATSILFAKNGVKVAVLDKSIESTEETVETITDNQGVALALKADVSNPAELKNAVDLLIANHKKLDIVFANAGINGTWAPIEELTPEDWDATLTVNLKGAFLTIKHTLPYLKREDDKTRTSIVINSSINGSRLFSANGATAYICSKAAQVALAKSLALQYAKHNIRTNVICTGDIETNIGKSAQLKGGIRFGQRAVPLTKDEPGRPEDVAHLAAFLSSDAASHISGTEIYIDGAESLLRMPLTRNDEERILHT
jgi:NAD(P)-dependent dehydrogenase (short-subunit alcohol dehydrogenase family)